MSSNPSIHGRTDKMAWNPVVRTPLKRTLHTPMALRAGSPTVGLDRLHTNLCSVTMPVGRNLWRGVRLVHLATALTAGGLGAAQGPQKLWDIWCKILHSSNLETPNFSFKKLHFFIAYFIISHKMFKKKTKLICPPIYQTVVFREFSQSKILWFTMAICKGG